MKHDPALKVSTKPRAIVIGSGFGGLAAALRLLARGYDVSVIEQLDKPGGRAYVYEQDGFVFDAGPTIITVPFLFEELWTLFGKKFSDDVNLVPMDPYFQMQFDDGDVFNYWGDYDRLKEEIARFSKQDANRFDDFLAYSKKTFEAGFVELGDVPFHKMSSMIKATPRLIGLGAVRTVYAKVADYIKNDKLRTALSFHPLLVGGNPFTTTSIYNLVGYLEHRWGVHFAMGGTGALVKAMVRLIESEGGEVLLNRKVDEILIEGGRAQGIRLENNVKMAADIIVSNADVGHTYKKLIAPSYRKTWTDKKVDNMRYSMSCFLWYFGTNKQYPSVEHHSILFGPRYRGLLTDIFKHKHLSDDFSLYLHRPTATDKTMAPDGCDSFYALIPVPHMDSGTDWEAMAKPFRDKVADFLESRALPGLKESIVTEHILTPLDFQNRLLSEKGAAFSFEPVLLQSAWFRAHNISEDVQGLYFVGAGTHPGAGLPGVVSSAKVLDKVIPDAAHFTKAR